LDEDGEEDGGEEGEELHLSGSARTSSREVLFSYADAHGRVEDADTAECLFH
jgi:hypothetical protein